MILGFSYLFFQQYWWMIISLLGALFVFLTFVQGGQSMIFTFTKDEKERTLMINVLGRKWELTFTTLVTFGGAFFASFPLFYSTSFGGAYWVWIAILFAFVIQAVSYEYRLKPGNPYGKRTFEVLLFLNGLLGTILIGTAVGTFFTGANFSVDPVTHFSKWEHSWLGLEAILDIQNVALGLSVFFLSRVIAILYFQNAIDDAGILKKAKKQLMIDASIFLVFFLFFLIRLMFLDGFVYDENMHVSKVPNKYFHNLIEQPWILGLLLIGVVFVLFALYKGIFKDAKHGFTFVGIGTVMVVFSLFLIAGLNNTCFYPSNYDIQSSLHIQNACSSEYTLKTMSYVSLFIPFVVAYIWWVWKSINKTKLSQKELENDSHVY